MSVNNEMVGELIGQARSTVELCAPAGEQFDIIVADKTERIGSFSFSRADVGYVFLRTCVVVETDDKGDEILIDGSLTITIDYLYEGEKFEHVVKPRTGEMYRLLDSGIDNRAAVDEDDIDRALYLLGAAREMKVDADTRIASAVDAIRGLVELEQAVGYASPDDETPFFSSEQAVRVYDGNEGTNYEVTLGLSVYEDGKKLYSNNYASIETEHGGDKCTICIEIDQPHEVTLGNEANTEEVEYVTYEESRLQMLEAAIETVRRLS